MPESASLLVELLTEELPPKSLMTLANAFRNALFEDLKIDGFVTGSSSAKTFATPRRLAVLISDVAEIAPDRENLVKGPSVKSGLDANGKPTQALLGFARKRGVAVDMLERISDGKQEVFAHRDLAKGGHLETNLEIKVEAALKGLPIPKLMRWGSGDAQFVRPAHGLVMLRGDRVVRGRVFGIESGNTTSGHRFMGKGTIALANAKDYEARLKSDGMVIADFAERRAEIERRLNEEAARQKASLGEYRGLLDEVTALVEYPSVYVGTFESRFLEVPQECLILTMRQHQKYFPLFDSAGKLLPKFLIVSNMDVPDPRHIIAGNERVVRPRLEDARFFFNQDRRTRLETRVPQLAAVVYHNKLGSLLERVERIQLLAGGIARALGAEVALAERAAWLSKADLLTGMVAEFPELQGIMGRHYALLDGEPGKVADAIEAHYRPGFAGDGLPADEIGASVALADKLDTLAGLFGTGERPSGEKDPFALRRAALGIVRILIEKKFALPLNDLVNSAFEGFSRTLKIGNAHTDLETFIFERLRGYLRDAGNSANEIESVLSMRPMRLDQVPLQLAAIREFTRLPEAQSLAAANKRVANILKQSDSKGESFSEARAEFLREAAEIDLFNALKNVSREAIALFQAGDYTGYLKAFAVLKSPIDAFFESVMVMTDEPEVRHNRLALLADLRREMNRVADISRLAA